MAGSDQQWQEVLGVALTEDRYRSKSKHRQVFDVSFLESPTHLLLEASTKVLDLAWVVVRLIVLVPHASKLDLDGSPFGKLSFGGDSHGAVVERDRGLVVTDRCADLQDVRRLRLADRQEPIDSFLMLALHLAEHFHGINAPLQRVVDLTMMRVAREHQVVRVIREQWRKDKIPTLPAGRRGDDVGDVALVPVEVSRCQIAVETLMAVSILAAATRAPQTIILVTGRASVLAFDMGRQLLFVAQSGSDRNRSRCVGAAPDAINMP